MKKIIIAASVLALSLPASFAIAGEASNEALQKLIASSWKDPNSKNPKGAKPDWASRLTQDGLQKSCSTTRNSPDNATAERIKADAKASIV